MLLVFGSRSKTLLLLVILVISFRFGVQQKNVTRSIRSTDDVADEETNNDNDNDDGEETTTGSSEPIESTTIDAEVEAVDKDLPENSTDGSPTTEPVPGSNSNEEEEVDGGEESDDDEEDDEDYSEEEGTGSGGDDDEDGGECTLNKYLSHLNITAMYPDDRDKLKEEVESLDNDFRKLRVAPDLNFTFTRLRRLLNVTNQAAERQGLRESLQNFFHSNFELFLELDVGPACLNTMIGILSAMRRREMWSFKFIDAAGKLPPGILSGATSFLGNFDQCLSIKSPEYASEPYEGQYCLVKPILPLPDRKKYITVSNGGDNDDEQSIKRRQRLLNFLAGYKLEGYFEANPTVKFIEHIHANKGRMINFALCLPDICTSEQLEIAFNKFFYPLIGLPLELQESSCWTSTKLNNYSLYLDGYATFSITIIAFLGLLVIGCTIYDVYLFYGPGKDSPNVPPALDSFLTVFSAIRNTGRLFDRSSERLMVFDTLRLIIIILIGLTNAFYNPIVSQALHNISYSVPYELLSDPKYFFIRAPSLLNDGLFIIAAALFIRSIFRYLNRPNDTVTFFLYIIQRWIRLTFPLFGSILFLYLLPSTGAGPLWDRMIELVMPACQSPSSLASSLFYYSNWNFVKLNYTTDDANVVCNPDSWLLSIVFQLNIAFFMIVLLMYQSPKNGLRLMIMLILASIILNLSPRLFHQNARTYYEITRQPSLWHLRRSYYLYHQNIIQYIGSFSIGLLLGYAIIIHENMLAKEEESSPKDSKDQTEDGGFQRHRIWIYNIVALLGLIIPFVWVNQFFIQNQSPQEWSVLLFFSAGRFAFSLSFAWIIYVCVTKKSPILYNFLTPWPIQPMARLAFSIFLVQPLVQYHRMYTVKETYVMTFRGTIEHYFCDFILSIFFGYLLYLLFEAPALRLKFFFDRSTFDPESSETKNGNHSESNNNRKLTKLEQMAGKKPEIRINDSNDESVISIRF